MNKNGRHVLLLDDMIHRRIQILYKVDLKTFDKNAIDNLVKLIIDSNYSWGKLKDESKESVGIKLEGIKKNLKMGRSTNYNIDGKRTIKKTTLSEAIENKTTVEDLCYENIVKKLKTLFLGTKSQRYHLTPSFINFIICIFKRVFITKKV